MLNHAHMLLIVPLFLQAGQPTDEVLVAQELADLVDRVGCSRCVVWGKSDAVVALIREASPELRLGCVVVNETAAQRSSGLDRLLRMPSVQVRSFYLSHVVKLSQKLDSEAKFGRKIVKDKWFVIVLTWLWS